MNNDLIARLSPLLEEVRRANPLVHHITNYVTANDCANITLAMGASPIMADAVEEAGDIAACAAALVLNIGTLNSATIAAMMAAGKAANQRGIPVILDPVGAGASPLRNEATHQLLTGVDIAVIRGNLSELCFVAGLASSTKGVDACAADAANDPIDVAQRVARQYHCIAAITGAVDTISDGTTTIRLENGHPKLSQITGTGCMCSSLVGCFCGAAPAHLLHATAAALLSMGVAGELAHEGAGQLGNGSYRIAVMDEISRLTENVLRTRGHAYEV